MRRKFGGAVSAAAIFGLFLTGCSSGSKNVAAQPPPATQPLAASTAPATQPAAPVAFQCEGGAFVTARQAWLDGDPKYKTVLENIIKAANKDLADGPYTIVNKKHPLKDVDVHDYVSLAPYFWPNPDTHDKLPYVRHDGERNPEIRAYDIGPFDEFSGHVYRLALAGYITGDRKYSDRAAELIRVWFIDPATRMNPNLQHAQLVEGVNDGRGTGIIESNRFYNVIDGIGLLDASGPSTWSADDREKLKQWFDQYRTWMQTSEHGKAEAAAANNHGAWYAVQLTVYSLFLGDDATAKQTVEAAKQRIAKQIQPDGKQPLELVRTKAFGYSTFNLSALTMLADLGQRVGVDLWTYQTPDGRGIRPAIEYLIPFATGEKKWPYQQIGGFSGSGLFVPLRRAAAAYHEPRYDQIANQIGGGDRDDVKYPGTFKGAGTTQPFGED